MHRRHFVTILGAVSATSIAGCGLGSGEEGEQSPTTNQTNTPPTTPTDTPTETPTDTPTETPTETPEPASFKLVRYDIPEQVQIGREFTFKITIKNTGDRVGDYSAPLYAKTSAMSWQKGGEWTFTDVKPGETVTGVSEKKYTLEYIRKIEYRLGQFSKTATVQAIPAKLGWGEEFVTPDGYRVRVDEPTLQSAYEYEDYSDETELKTPENGGQWAFVNIWVKNETGNTKVSPLVPQFTLVAGDSQYDGEVIINNPVKKGAAFEGGELQPGSTRSGWIAFQLPDDVSMTDLRMSWSKTTFNGDIAVNWLDKS